jgi:hypothetical protein
MNTLTIRSDTQHQIKPLIEAAIENELRLLEAGFRKAKNRMEAYEGRYRLSTADFIEKYENDELAEIDDFENWIGELRLFNRLNEKIRALRGIRFEN